MRHNFNGDRSMGFTIGLFISVCFAVLILNNQPVAGLAGLALLAVLVFAPKLPQ